MIFEMESKWFPLLNENNVTHLLSFSIQHSNEYQNEFIAKWEK